VQIAIRPSAQDIGFSCVTFFRLEHIVYVIFKHYPGTPWGVRPQYYETLLDIGPQMCYNLPRSPWLHSPHIGELA